MTIGDMYGPAMEITTQGAADKELERLVNILQADHGKTLTEALKIARTNLGYYAGYWDDETRARVEKLFKCEHPIFGAIAEKGPPTPEEAFRLGQMMGEKMRQKEQSTQPPAPCVPCVREIDLSDE